uniref:Uncharacterized protein DKFZp547D0916 n=1 Tax=Homo sapiens TaxID=9606 RepID=Q8ND79_HUMAN|nr:hypothetical protein [Homo sapiens]
MSNQFPPLNGSCQPAVLPVSPQAHTFQRTAATVTCLISQSLDRGPIWGPSPRVVCMSQAWYQLLGMMQGGPRPPNWDMRFREQPPYLPAWTSDFSSPAKVTLTESQQVSLSLLLVGMPWSELLLGTAPSPAGRQAASQCFAGLSLRRHGGS